MPHYSSKTALLASLLLLLFFSGPALMAADDAGSQVVTVDASGTDATDARAKAMAQGSSEAFRQLLTRRNPAQAAAFMAASPPAVIAAVQRGFEVLDEKIAPGHYHATLRYHFDPHVLDALAPSAAPTTGATPPAKNGSVAVVPAGSTTVIAPANAPPGPAPIAIPRVNGHPSKAVLVLPVYRDQTGLRLWQDDNQWRLVWYEAALESGGGLVVAPLGDLNDRVDVDDSNAENATAAGLSRLFSRYGVGEIYVLTAFYNRKADPKPTLEVTFRRITPDKIEPSHRDYILRVNETLEALMARAASDIARNLYRIQTIDPNKIEYNRVKEIAARINTTDIKEWENLRKKLLMRSNIVGLRLTSISYYETRMVITFKGTPDMLGKTLVASGLRVLEDGDMLVLSIK